MLKILFSLPHTVMEVSTRFFGKGDLCGPRAELQLVVFFSAMKKSDVYEDKLDGCSYYVIFMN